MVWDRAVRRQQMRKDLHGCSLIEAMCRALLYLGEPVLLDNFLYQPDSALVRQSYMPKMLNLLEPRRLRAARLGSREPRPRAGLLLLLAEPPGLRPQPEEPGRENPHRLPPRPCQRRGLPHARRDLAAELPSVPLQERPPGAGAQRRPGAVRRDETASCLTSKTGICWRKSTAPPTASGFTPSSSPSSRTLTAIRAARSSPGRSSARSRSSATRARSSASPSPPRSTSSSPTAPSSPRCATASTSAASPPRTRRACTRRISAISALWYTAGRDYGLHDDEWKMTGGAENATSILIASEPLTRDTAAWVEVPEYSMLHATIKKARPQITLSDLS